MDTNGDTTWPLKDVEALEAEAARTHWGPRRRMLLEQAAAMRKAYDGAMSAAIVQPEPLTALDRCDRCGAQAYLRARTSSGFELLMCAHHAREHEPAFAEKGITIELDDRPKLAPAPAEVV